MQLFTRRLQLAMGFIRVLSQVTQERKEFLRLAHEKTAGGETLYSAHGGPLGVGGANDGDDGELSIQEYGRFRHDQVLLQCLGV